MVESSIIRDLKGFLDLADEWNRLAEQTDPSSVFLRHEWFEAAWAWCSAECRLALVCIERNGELIGICPLMLRAGKHHRIDVNIIEFLAVPDTQECAVLTASENRKDVVDALSSVLIGDEIKWDILRLSKLSATAESTAQLASSLRNSIGEITTSYGGTNMGIGLRDDWRSFYSRRSRRLKKGNNLIVNRLKRAKKEVDIQCYASRAEPGFDVDEVLKTLVCLSASSWKAGYGLALDSPGPNRFIKRLTEYSVKNSWFLAWILYIDKVPAAMEYQLDFNGVVSGLRADFDPKFDEFSPGTLLNWKIIERLFDTDATQYFMGPGSNAYKKRWAEQQVELLDIVAYGRSLPGRTSKFLDLRVKPFVNRLRKVRKPGSSYREPGAGPA